MRADGVAVGREQGDGGHRKLRNVHEQSRPGGSWPGRRDDDIEHAMEARSGREQQELARRMGPRGAGRSAGAVEDTGDVAWVCHNIEDVHATAALAADGDDGIKRGKAGCPGEGPPAGVQGMPTGAAQPAGEGAEMHPERCPRQRPTFAP